MRMKSLDEIRGIAFILMMVHHLNYFVDVSNKYKTNYASNPVVNQIGNISRTIFIFLVGVSVYQAYSKTKSYEEFLRKRSWRSLVILAHALFLSLVTYLLYPNIMIRFGVLHFIAVGSMIGALLVIYPRLCLMLALIISLINSFDFHPDLGSFLNLILGTRPEYGMMDYFPLLKWLPLLLIGIFSGFIIENPQMEILKSPIFEKLGKNSLNLYTLHVFLLLVILYKN